jgi:hypothetical protein
MPYSVLVQTMFNQIQDAGELDLAPHEGLYGTFVGRIKHGCTGASGLGHLIGQW